MNNLESLGLSDKTVSVPRELSYKISDEQLGKLVAERLNSRSKVTVISRRLLPVRPKCDYAEIVVIYRMDKSADMAHPRKKEG